jgi:hypothetical protein
VVSTDFKGKVLRVTKFIKIGVRVGSER